MRMRRPSGRIRLEKGRCPYQFCGTSPAGWTRLCPASAACTGFTPLSCAHPAGGSSSSREQPCGGLRLPSLAQLPVLCWTPARLQSSGEGSSLKNDSCGGVGDSQCYGSAVKDFFLLKSDSSRKAVGLLQGNEICLTVES